MAKQLLPKEVVEQWPEIFQYIDVKAVPLEYLDSMRITFSNGKIWVLKLSSTAGAFRDVNDLKDSLDELVEHYKSEIENIDFRLDVSKVKKDIVKKTNIFLKKAKTKK
jgi:hypothetical protein